MKTLRIQHGDLVPGPGGLETVSGAAMLTQDLRGALAEPVGNDRFHPGWGSYIDSFVGAPLDDGTAFQVEQEVNRVIGNYMTVQDEKIRRDQTSGRAPRFTTDDVLARVRRVSTTYSRDIIGVTIEVETLSRTAVSIDTEIGGSG